MKNSKGKSGKHGESGELARLRQQVASLADSLKQLQEQLADQSKVLANLVARLDGTTPAKAPALAVAEAASDSAVTPELLIVMAAAVSSFLGKKVRIRSAKMLQSPYEIINPWAQQGRVTVQASHHPRSA